MMSIHDNETSIQNENDVNTPKKVKDSWIQIRINSDTKDEIKQKAESDNKSVSQYILDKVLTRAENVNTDVTTTVNTNIKDRLLQDKADQGEKFKSGFEILAKAFSFAMKDELIQLEIAQYFKNLPAGSEKFGEIKKLILQLQDNSRR